MILNELVAKQYWLVPDFFAGEEFNEIKKIYRENRMPFSMVYDHRLLTDYNTTPELQKICADYAGFVSSITKLQLKPQVAYVSIDLPGSKIMMHRLHPDIAVQVQIPMGNHHDQLGYTMCTDSLINNADSEDYKPIKPVTVSNSVTAGYSKNIANIFANNPRAFVGMLHPVPDNTVREVIVMSYTL